MFSKLTLIITIGILSVEGKISQNADTGVVWKKYCIGMLYDRRDTSVSGIIAPMTKWVEDENQIPQLGKGKENPDYSSIQDDDKPGSAATCVGYETSLPIPRVIYNKIKAMVDKAKQAKKEENMSGDNKPSVREQTPPREVYIEWKNNKRGTPAPKPRYATPYATINGNAVDMVAVTKYIDDLLQSSRRISDRWVEMGNGVFKSELIDYPPDDLKNRLLQLIAIKEAKEKRSQSLN